MEVYRNNTDSSSKTTKSFNHQSSIDVEFNLVLILFFPMFPFDPPENIRKPVRAFLEELQIQ